MKILIDDRMPSEYREGLSKVRKDVELTGFSGPGKVGCGVYRSIKGHPDIYFSRIREKTFICAPSVHDKWEEYFFSTGARLIPGRKDPFGKYPDTSRYNVLNIGNDLFHNTVYTDTGIIHGAEEDNKYLVNIGQGYAACSSVTVGSGALITADRGVAAAASDRGIEVLLIAPGYVDLPGESHGFIGGASGQTPEGTVIFLGGLNTHPDNERIKDFMTKKEIRYMEMPGIPLLDAGGMIIL